MGRPSTRAEREAWGAIATRDRKQYGIDTDTWREEITARAAEHGLDRKLVEEIVAGALERRERGELTGDGTLEQDGARVGESELAEVLTGPTGLTERANTFDESVVLREFAAAAPQGSRVDTVRGQAGRFIGRDDVLATRGRTFTSAAGAVAHGVEQSVLICRDNETRRALNTLAREHRREVGELGEEISYGPATVAVGDRVICRNNERDLDIDNGTRGTVRHVHDRGIVIETDAHLVRELPAGYVAEHVEHAYALTGHGMQGATVERATVVAGPHDLSLGWSYTALSRARGTTRLLVRDSEAGAAGREEDAPATRTSTSQHREVLARVGRQMLVRDDEDLAIDQLNVAGRFDDPQLTRPAVEPLQEQQASRAEPLIVAPAGGTLGDLCHQLERLRAQLTALPTAELGKLDALDARARELTERRDALRRDLDRLPEPRERRFGRNEDPHLVDRTRLVSALAGAEDQLQHSLTQRTALARELGDPTAIREDRDGLRNAIDTLARKHTELSNELAEREVEHRSSALRDALGERPERQSDAERWDQAARTLARYRIEYEISERGDPLGDRPAAAEQRHEYERAQRAREQLLRELGREAPGADLEVDR